MCGARKQVVVVGTGLAGLTTTHQLLEKGINVVLLEKTGVVGMASNSNKASSGINGVYTEQQKSQGIQDSVEEFVVDSVRSARSSARRDLIDNLTNRSKNAIDWLTNTFGIDLSAVSRLGGHSKARTHRGSGNLPPGYAIVSTLVKALGKFEQDKRLRILKKSRVMGLIMDKAGKVVGVEYEDSNQQPPALVKLFADQVVLATGGFSADFVGESSLLSKFRSDLIHLPSTNGNQTTGDGIKAAHAVGAQLVDMDKVQVHPTGFVDPQDPDAKWKFLAGEVLRGNGGVLLSLKGKRFVDELTTRDHVTEAIFNTGDSTVKLVIPEGSYPGLKTHLDFYIAKGLIQKQTIAELADSLSVPVAEVEAELAPLNAQQDTKFGRTHFGPAFTDTVYVGTVTPVLHFSMGGLKIDNRTRVLDESDSPIEGLYAVGEVSGGVHGHNRLGGSSLLECVVFGTIASEEIAAQ